MGLKRPSSGTSSVTELIVADGATFDTTTLVVDETNNRVGIGTATPTASLEIDGDIQLTPTAISTAHVKTTGSLDVRCTANLKLGTDGADSIRLGRINSTGAKIHLRSGADTDLVVTNSKVGIGTETPYTDLTIEGTITLKEQAAADGDTAAYGQLWVKTASPNQLYFTTDAGDDIQITSGTSMASSGASALNDLSDASFSSGDLTITALDTLTTSASAHDAAGTAVKILAGATTAGSTNNIAGGALTLGGGQGKGSGAGGDIIFQTANAGGSGSSLNAYATALTISDDLSSTFAGGITSTGGVNTLGATEITQGADGGGILFTLDNDDTDKIAFKIEAANIDESIINIDADALTTAHVMEVTADALTDGSILKLVSDSSDNSPRTLIEVTNDNTAAVATTLMVLKNDAAGSSSLIVETTAAEIKPLVSLIGSVDAPDKPVIMSLTKINGAADDYDIGVISFNGENDADPVESVEYVKMLAGASDITNGTEGGEFYLSVMDDGALVEALAVGLEDGGTTFALNVNRGGADLDLIVYGANVNNLFRTDAANDAVSIGTNPTTAGAIFQVNTTTRFSRPFPSMADGERDALSNVIVGACIFNTTEAEIQFYNGSAWRSLDNSAI